ncbi:MAG: DEAD/DEAH box helicase, partial [Candidatus Omnitrophica bacterium]|nr:DEAD/DEAH box helicase [Candidatus Omnitrophota bacterium]
MKFTVPTPIQHKTIPIAIEDKDIIGVAQTGTGKTLAFAVPIIQRLSQRKGRALILVPTRELAIQVDEAFGKIAPSFGI